MKRPLVGSFWRRFYFNTQSLQTMSNGCCTCNSFTFGLLVHEMSFKCISAYISLYKMKRPLVYKPCPKDAVCQISEYLDCQFMRRRFF